MAIQASPPIRISSRQTRLLDEHIRKRSTANHEVKRIQIILKGSKGQSMYSVSKEIGLSLNPTYAWRKRWERSYPDLLAFEKGKSGEGVSDLELLGQMLLILKDRARPGSPAKFTLSQKQQIVALACREPSEYGIPINRWTHEMLAHVAQVEKIVTSISPRYVGKILKKSGITTA